MNQAFLFVLLGIVIADAIYVQELVEEPKSYSFGYDITDEYGNQQRRAEVADANGAVRGTYGILDKNGYARQVVYVADDHGFRASVASNEPGVESSEPAAAIFSTGDKLQSEEVVLPTDDGLSQPIVGRLSKSKSI